jgi:hypothetical protein
MKRYNKSKNRRNNKNKTKRTKRNNTFRMKGRRMKLTRMKGGNINPFSEIGTAVSSLTSYLQSSIGSLSVPPIQGSQPVNVSASPTQQYLGSSLNTPVSNIQSVPSF